MLTKFETKIVSLAYQTFCKWVSIPFIPTDDGQVLGLTTKNRQLNTVVWILLIFTIIFRFSETPSVGIRNGVNGAILHSIFLISNSSNLLCKVNIWIHSTEFIQLITDVAQLNSVSGEILYLHVLFYALI